MCCLRDFQFICCVPKKNEVTRVFKLLVCKLVRSHWSMDPNAKSQSKTLVCQVKKTLSQSRHVVRSLLWNITCGSVHNDILSFNVSEQKERAELIEMDPTLLLLTMMIIVLYFFTKICLAVITAGQQRVLAVQAPALIDFRRQGAIQRLEDMTFQGATQVEDQTINRRAENRVRPQPQEHNE